MARSLLEDPPDWRSREVRLGLVLYGGVSLAIYINGVAREFFDAVCGRGVYKLIKVLTDSEIIVDVVSGTSAGGINGILLAYALCNEREFGDSAVLWRRDGGIRQLLRDPTREAASWPSVLDSEGYYQPALEAAFRRMGSYVHESGEERSRIDELDVYVTGTDVDGSVWTQFDDAGHPIDVKEHRAVFVLKHRPGRDDPFSAGRNEPFNPRPGGIPADRAPTYEAVTLAALAKLSRITSCFPAAFAPVHVRGEQDRQLSTDARLQDWGRLGKESAFLDGGVLDNKPFTHTLGAIFARHADRRVERKLIYVEPDPETFQRRLQASQPNIFQAVVTALIGIPGYESISNDLKLIAEHNDRVQQYQRVVKLCERYLGAEAGIDAARARGGERAPEPAVEVTRRLYDRSRLVDLSDRVVRGVLRKDGRNQVLDGQDRRVAAQLVCAFDSAARDPLRIFDEFDVTYRQRRLYHVVYLIYETLYPPEVGGGAADAPALAPQYRAVWRAFNRQLDLLQIIRAVMEWVVDDAPIEWKGRTADQVWASVESIYRALLRHHYPSIPPTWAAEAGAGTTAWLDTPRLSLVYRELTQRVREIVQMRSEDLAAATVGGAGSPRNVLHVTDGHERAIVDAYRLAPDDPVRLAYERFAAIDEHVFPLELLGGVHQKDIIPTLRISPRDAEKGFSQRGFSDKIAGDALYHFGGFFKRSWRSNDILWGRLDGGCQLVELLLARERLVQIAETPDLRRKVRQRVLPPAPPPTGGPFAPAFDPAKLFPRAGDQTHQEIGTWLQALLSEDAARRSWALAGDELSRKTELIIEAAQLETIHNELPNVITDALEEQAEWSEVAVTVAPQDGERGRPGNAAGTADVPGDWVFKPLDQRVDPFVAVVAAAERMRTAMGEVAPTKESAPRPRETVLGRFFRQSYRVGTETVTKDIPPRVLLEILAIALLVVRNCVLSAFGAQGERIRTNLLYRVMVALPLRAFYFLTIGLAGPQARRVKVIVAVAVACLLVIGWCLLQWADLVDSLRLRHPVLVAVGAGLILLIDLGVYRFLARRRA